MGFSTDGCILDKLEQKVQAETEEIGAAVAISSFVALYGCD